MFQCMNHFYGIINHIETRSKRREKREEVKGSLNKKQVTAMCHVKEKIEALNLKKKKKKKKLSI